MNTLYKTTRFATATLLLPLIFILFGCGTTSVGKLATPSGRPEITIPNTNIQTVMDVVAAWLAEQGRPIDATGVYTISSSFTRTSPGLLAIKSFYTSVFTIVQNDSNVSIYESTVDQKNNDELNEQVDYESMQKELAQISEFLKTR